MSGVLKIVRLPGLYEIHGEEGLVLEARPVPHAVKSVPDIGAVMENLAALISGQKAPKKLSINGRSVHFRQEGTHTSLCIRAGKTGISMPVLKISINDGLPELPAGMAVALCDTIKVSRAPRPGAARKPAVR